MFTTTAPAPVKPRNSWQGRLRTTAIFNSILQSPDLLCFSFQLLELLIKATMFSFDCLMGRGNVSCELPATAVALSPIFNDDLPLS
jgi:hypothetical protein